MGAPKLPHFTTAPGLCQRQAHGRRGGGEGGYGRNRRLGEHVLFVIFQMVDGDAEYPGGEGAVPLFFLVVQL